MSPRWDLAENAWNGDLGDYNVHPAMSFGGHEDMGDGIGFVSAFANVTVVETKDGLVLIDTSSPFFAGMVHSAVREMSAAPVRAAVYTHGHVDHVFGILAFDAEAKAKGLPLPEVIAHENVRARFARYLLTNGYNGRINQRQFNLPAPIFPDSFRDPDMVYRDDFVLEIGGVRFELYHDLGETDDHTWVYIPEKRALCTGDLFIWASPNCGNPQKAQRYPREWAAALRKMDQLGAEKLFPGHGPPIIGAHRVKQALTDTAALLEDLVGQTLDYMNQGAPLDEVLASVVPNKRLLERPYLRPIYDDPEFIVRNIWRLYGGWYDGNPAHLKPAREADLARVIVEMAGGAEQLAARALVLANQGSLRVATELVEMAYRAAPKDEAVRMVRATIYDKRAEGETSLMAKAIFGSAARQSRE
ncbi:MAG: MBL fold metallo-hydrolase [Polyangiaceae bacterium]|nr:MBL fold metallo-hydrolase [Polyangiaceae bacterium]